MSKQNRGKFIRVLVACEESQRVCTAFRERGHEAYSCDIMDCSGGHPEWHIKGDVVPLLNGRCSFVTMGGQQVEIPDRWDLIIAHPPCTYLTVSANKYYETSLYGESARQRQRDRYKAIVFFMLCILADCDRVAVENPIGIMSTAYKKPTQIIQPYEHGEPVRKATCLWLKGLPALTPTHIVAPKLSTASNGDNYSGVLMMARDDSGKILSWKDPRTAIERSKTFPGVAKAFATQWG